MQLKPGLYLVATPIGNLGDITLRAIETLTNSDVIFCEDTRVSSKLLAKHQIDVPLKIYNDNSDDRQRVYIKNLIESGKVISLISDAGTPLISDPGYKLIEFLKQNNLYIDSLPGPCAAITALSMSALPTDRFIFSGFLPKTKEAKIKTFLSLKEMAATMIFYETANRLVTTLIAAEEALGNRQVNVARELSKLHQESKTGLLSDIRSYYEQNPARGEIVLLISGKSENISDIKQAEQEIEQLMNQGKTARSASEDIFLKYNKQFSKSELYKLANKMKK